MMSSSAANKQLVRRYVDEVWNRGELGALDRYVGADYVFVPPDGTPPIRGPEGLRRHVGAMRRALHGLVMRIECMVAEGDRVAWSWTMTGVHAGPGLGPPTGRRVATRGVAIYRIAGGRIVERGGEADVLGLLTQLGLLPPLAEVERSLHGRGAAG
jgi:steroid delta-isomerase-like uncharacterized protein